MVVDDLDVVGSRSGPSETDAPLVVDTNAVSVGAVTLEFLETIAGRYPQVSDLVCGVEDEQFAQGGALGSRVEAFGSLTLSHPFGVVVME